MSTKELTTSEIVSNMLRENTGRHFLDSGDAYGRHWEKNQEIDFEKMPEWRIDTYEGSVETISRSVYHFLLENVTYNHELQNLYDNKYKNSEESHLADMEDFAASRHKENNPYPEKPFSVNTYNHDSALDQTIQYVIWDDIDFGECYALQIHNGADARGGYTQPKMFTSQDEFALLRDTYINLTCPECGSELFSESGGYDWHNGPEELHAKDDKIICPECNHVGMDIF